MFRSGSESQADNLVAAVNAANSVNKIWQKNGKHGPSDDGAWRKAMEESMSGEIIKTSPPDPQKTTVIETQKNERPPEIYKAPEDMPALEEIDGMMASIRKLSEEPEKLMESHLGVFTEPSPPGRMLNSKG